ncbi:MAG TPA: hypothetical protein PLP42_15390 [Acidobacteriota bacterium]|nr:hypothetical protein [Acidobacteriota bacterium]
MRLMRLLSGVVVVLLLVGFCTAVAWAEEVYYRVKLEPRGTEGEYPQQLFTFKTDGYVTSDNWVEVDPPISAYGETFTRIRYGVGRLKVGQFTLEGLILERAEDDTPQAGEIAAIELYVSPAPQSEGVFDLSGEFDTAVWILGTHGLTTLWGEGGLLAITEDPERVVQMSSIWAQRRGGQVVVGWETASENGTAAFRVLRSENGGPYEVVSELIPAQGGANFGARYLWTDAAVRSGSQYNYVIEEVEDTGTTNQYGPVGVSAQGPSQRRR